jgi:hypothetical protein
MGQTSDCTRRSTMGKIPDQPQRSRLPHTAETASGLGNSEHFFDGAGDVGDVHHAERAHHDVERCVGKGELLGFHALEARVGDTALLRDALCSLGLPLVGEAFS